MKVLSNERQTAFTPILHNSFYQKVSESPKKVYLLPAAILTYSQY